MSDEPRLSTTPACTVPIAIADKAAIPTAVVLISSCTSVSTNARWYKYSKPPFVAASNAVTVVISLSAPLLSTFFRPLLAAILAENSATSLVALTVATLAADLSTLVPALAAISLEAPAINCLVTSFIASFSAVITEVFTAVPPTALPINPPTKFTGSSITEPT